MAIECDVCFENTACCVLNCGETTEGNIRITSPTSLQAKRIFVRLKGKAIVFYEHLDRNIRGCEVFCTSDEQVFGRSLQLSAGVNEYKFSLSVPDDFPPSISSAQRFGYIDYKLIVYLETERSLKKLLRLPITIQGKLDLRTDPSYQLPIHVSCQKTFLFNKHSLLIDMTIPRSGFTIEQSIPFCVVVRNESAVDCYDSKVILVQCLDYMSSKDPKILAAKPRELQEKLLGPILKHSNKRFDSRICIPSTACITTQDRSRIIKVHYKLRFVAMVKGPRMNGELECPVIIGSIPFDVDCDRPPTYAELNCTNNSLICCDCLA